MLTIITHFYNEEYILPWWCRHHKPYVDRCILVDYGSTDRSVEIIKELCPEWEIVKTRNKDFGALENTLEIQDIEHSIDGFKIALTTTEFLVGDYNVLKPYTDLDHHYLLIPIIGFVDEVADRRWVDPDVPLYRQIKYGYPIDGITNEDVWRVGSRHLHSGKYVYKDIISGDINPGRHYPGLPTLQENDIFIIFKYSYAPMTPEFIQRKLQIQHKIPFSDRLNNYSCNHTDFNNPNGLTKERLIEWWSEHKENIVDHSEIMRKYLHLNGIDF